MILYPTIELMNGHPVSLHRGRVEEPQIWHVDPVERVREWAAAGAEWFHCTDLDAVSGKGNNNALLEELILKAGIPMQLGGGFRSMEAIATWIDKGAGRVVLGTIAVTQPQLVREAAKRFPDQIVVALDVYRGKVMTHGWKEATAYDPEEFLGWYEGSPLAGFIVTDIDADIGDSDGALALFSRLGKVTRAPLIARGTARRLDDISRLKYLPHISGAVVGRALFDRAIFIEEALAVCAAPAPKAEFI